MTVVKRRSKKIKICYWRKIRTATKKKLKFPSNGSILQSIKRNKKKYLATGRAHRAARA